MSIVIKVDYDCEIDQLFTEVCRCNPFPTLIHAIETITYDDGVKKFYSLYTFDLSRGEDAKNFITKCNEFNKCVEFNKDDIIIETRINNIDSEKFYEKN